MIQANELRIGNITEQGVIKNFWERGVHVGFGKCYEFNELKPIPLNEEWFLKLGFTTFGETKSMVVQKEYVMGLISVSFLRNGKRNIHVGTQRVDNGERLKYVHQLQNLYFALTNQELEIKEL